MPRDIWSRDKKHRSWCKTTVTTCKILISVSSVTWKVIFGICKRLRVQFNIWFDDDLNLHNVKNCESMVSVCYLGLTHHWDRETDKQIHTYIHTRRERDRGREGERGEHEELLVRATKASIPQYKSRTQRGHPLLIGHQWRHFVSDTSAFWHYYMNKTVNKTTSWKYMQRYVLLKLKSNIRDV